MAPKFDLSPCPGYIFGEQFSDDGSRTGAVFQSGKLVEKAYGLDDPNSRRNADASPAKVHLKEGAYCGYFMPFFGHLLTEFLPRYEQLRIIGRLDLPILVHPAPWVREPEKQLRDFAPIPEFLSEFGIPFESLQFCCSDVEVDNLFYTHNTINLSHYVDHEMVLIANSLRARFDFPVAGKKIFLSRSQLGAEYRKSDNALEVDRIFQEFGFEILHPQELPLRKQIAEVCSATMIAGEEGSALHLSMFNAALETCIILDSGRFTRPDAELSTQKLLNDRLGCQTIFCPPMNRSIDHQTAAKMQSGGRFTVDVDALVGILTDPNRYILREAMDAGSDGLFSCPKHSGEHYQSVLRRFHIALEPSTYLEIGTAEGKTLELAECAALAVDPMFQVSTNVIGRKQSCQFFQMTSDDFFARHKPDELLGAYVDFAYLDGLHLFEYLLRDFINTERFCKTTSVIIMHDCIPTDSYLARRDADDLTISHVSPHLDWWAGDVWKVVAILKKYRPDLTVLAFDAPPTGLIAITNLDPSSTTLSRDYANITKEFETVENNFENFRDYWQSLGIIDTKSEACRSLIRNMPRELQKLSQKVGNIQNMS